MKSFIAWLLVLCMLLTCSIAVAETPQYKTTEKYISILEKNNLKYTYSASSNNQDKVQIAFYDSDFEINAFFNNSNNVFFRIWSEKTVSAGKTYALEVLNGLNTDYKWAKFLLDSDNTVTIQWDAVLPDDCSDILEEMLTSLISELCDEEITTKINSLY